MSRGPFEVLRHMHAEAACKVCRDVCDECKEYDEVIAQVEALVRVATESERLMRHAARCDRVEVGPADELREALAPFTPGQDSEGGHGR